jgi:hypothetical protein
LVQAKIGEKDKAIQDYQNVINIFTNTDYSILAQIKLQDPNDITDLKMDNLSMREYKVKLGMISPDEEEAEEKIVEAKPEEEVEEGDKLEQVIQQADEQQAEEMKLQQEGQTPEESPIESGEGQEESIQEEPAMENPFPEESGTDTQPDSLNN